MGFKAVVVAMVMSFFLGPGVSHALTLDKRLLSG